MENGWGACSSHGREEKWIQNFSRETWIEERMWKTWSWMGYNIKTDLIEIEWGCVLDSGGSIWGTVAGSCDHYNGPLISMDEGISWPEEFLLASQEAHCSMELVNLTSIAFVAVQQDLCYFLHVYFYIILFFLVLIGVKSDMTQRVTHWA
jgi:hypothetical protein